MSATLSETRSSFDLVAVIRAEYLEMPGLRLTLAQAARLWNVDQTTCHDALEGLIRSGFLYRSGEFYLRTSGRR